VRAGHARLQSLERRLGEQRRAQPVAEVCVHRRPAERRAPPRGAPDAARPEVARGCRQLRRHVVEREGGRRRQPQQRRRVGEQLGGRRGRVVDHVERLRRVALRAFGGGVHRGEHRARHVLHVHVRRHVALAHDAARRAAAHRHVRAEVRPIDRREPKDVQRPSERRPLALAPEPHAA